MKLTNKQNQSLEQVLYHLERALSYIEKDSTVVCIKSNLGSNDLFSNDREPFKLQVVNKDYGSNLMGLSMGIESLRNFINFYNK